MARQSVSQLEWLEDQLHGWSSLLIVPVFALANAGVELSPSALRAASTSPIAIGIVLSLVFGKFAGVWLASRAGVKLGIGRLPEGVGWGSLAGLAATAGLGFTVSLFVADLAFRRTELLEQAKVGILVASIIAAVLGYGLFRFVDTRSSGDAGSETDP
jgi:Na+/H+ antiporter NhaA